MVERCGAGDKGDKEWAGEGLGGRGSGGVVGGWTEGRGHWMLGMGHSNNEVASKLLSSFISSYFLANKQEKSRNIFFHPLLHI